MAETEYTDPARGTIAYATSAKVSVSIGGKTEVEFVATGDAATLLAAPEFAKHGYAGVPNQPLSGTPDQ